MKGLDLEVHLEALVGEFALCASFQSKARVLAILGPSGSGKSTLLRCLVGDCRPVRGSIRWAERTLVDTEKGVFLPPEKRRLGYVTQDPLLFPLMNLRQNLAFGMKQRKRAALEEVAESLRIAHLLHRRPRNLSGGEKQRVALGRVLLSEPSALLCDEPFSALDDALRGELVHVLREVLKEQNLPMVIVTHRVDEALALADEVLWMEGGEIRDRGRPEEVLSRHHERAEANLWTGVLQESRGKAELREVRVGGCCLSTCSDLPGGTRVALSVVPEHVSLKVPGRDALSSPRNRVPGRIVAMREDGPWILVEVEGAVRVRARVSREAFVEMRCALGEEVVAVIKASALRVL